MKAQFFLESKSKNYISVHSRQSSNAMGAIFYDMAYKKYGKYEGRAR